MITVTYIDHMGSDLSVVNAARVSFGKNHTGFDVIRDTKLIKYLAREKHYSPFNHTYVTFHVKAPVFVARQLVKHEYMPWNEISRRYVDEEPEMYIPEYWRGRSADKKQGSEGKADTLVSPRYAYEAALGTYNQLLADGVAAEMARMVLPQSMMTEWYWSGTMKAVHKMCSLRCKPDTQYESQLVANQIDAEMAKLFPVSWAALMENNDG